MSSTYKDLLQINKNETDGPTENVSEDWATSSLKKICKWRINVLDAQPYYSSGKFNLNIISTH